MSLDLSNLNLVFSLDEAVRVLDGKKTKSAVVDYLKYHLKKGRLKRVAREIYAAVPTGIDPADFNPDVFLIADAVRPDALIAHHGALELLGVAHSSWDEYIVWTQVRRNKLNLENSSIRFLSDPHPAWSRNDRLLGTNKMERQGCILRVTGPERTLVEGFRRPAFVGGIEELTQSARGFPLLDHRLLKTLLTIYGMSRLWAAVGWFLEASQQDFHVSEEFLDLCSQRKPKKPQYLIRDRQGGSLKHRWNLIIPDSLDPRSELNGP